MKYYFRAFYSEILKLRRTLSLWVTFLAPTVVTFLYFLILLSQDGARYYTNDPEAWWNMTKSTCSLWTAGMLPLYITLITALLGNIEHSQHHWKHLYALPIPRGSIYTAKWLATILLVTLATLILGGEILATGFLMRTLRPEMGFSHPVPLGTIALTLGGTLLAALLIISIHAWAALWFKSFAIASATGILATAANMMVMRSDKWGPIFPWSLPLHSYANSDVNLQLLYMIAVGGGLLVALLGCLTTTRRDVVG